MLIKTLLNKGERFKSFVYGSVYVVFVNGVEALVIDIAPRRNTPPICPESNKRRTMYDWQPPRLFVSAREAGTRNLRSVPRSPTAV